MAFDLEGALRPDLPPAAARWSGFPKYNFIGGHNAPETVPGPLLGAMAEAALSRGGDGLATYGNNSGPQGHLPLREGIARMLGARAGIDCAPDDILVTSGSLQALDLVYGVLAGPGDVVLVEAETYGGALVRLRNIGAEPRGVALDGEGLRPDALAGAIGAARAEGRRVAFVYTIPTVQNPTGAIMSVGRRREILEVAAANGLPVFEDDCYADLTWSQRRPPAMRALDGDGRVIYCGSFSKSIAPALRVGYILADWPAMGRMLALKDDGGSGAVEQMMLAEFLASSFDGHVADLVGVLKGKADALCGALDEYFGASAEFVRPEGGIFLWVTLPDQVDTARLFEVAMAEGVAINPGGEWSADPETGRHRMRLCFALPDAATIREGVARLAEICRREFGVPVRSANIEPGR